MELGLQISNFTWKGRGPKLGETLGNIARTAEDVGYSSLWVMDHLFQIPPIGSARMEMLEPYTALAFIAANTKTATVGTMVSGVTYRNPGYLCKQVSTLDVLSGGRAVLGLGAAWFDREHKAYGIPFPPLKERLDRLEETVLVLKQLWSREDGRFEGKHYQFKETLNSPQPLQKPHPPLVIGGRGEKKTIKLAAKYADAYNIHTDVPEVARHKFEVLRAHCDAMGRDYNDIKRTVLMAMDPGEAAEHTGRLVEQLGLMAEAGAQAAYGYLPHVDRLATIEVMGRDVLPQVRSL